MGAFDDLIPGAKPSAGAFEDLIPSAPKRSAVDVIRDVGVTALKGAVGLPQAVVGLADIPTGGRVGKFLEENVGYRPGETQEMLAGLYSDAQRAANAKVQDADGFVDTLKTAIDNPSTIATTIGESLPQMLGGAAVARGITTLAPKVAPWIAGALGEGVIGAGSAASQIREQTEDGLLTPKQSLAAAASGAGTAVLGAAGGKLSQKLGIGDIDTMLASKAGGSLPPGKTAAGFVKAVVGGGISEGAFEELPQSVQEQMLQNYALDRPLTEGVGNAAAMGLLSGAAMGGGAGGYSSVMAARGQGREGAAAPEAASPAVAGAPAAAPAAPPVPQGAPVSADEVLGTVEQRPNEAADALNATPRTLTALDRVQEIDARLAATPAGQDAELEPLRQERAELTRDWPATVPGAPASFSTETGARLEGQYALIEADDMVTSHDRFLRRNAAYPQDLQPRERERAASEMQISSISQRLDPARLGASADAATGAPIIGADGLVESGNARSIALSRVYAVDGEKAEEYRGWLRANAEQFGLSPDQVAGMSKPVLVRVRRTPVNRAEFARQANASTVAAMSPTEQARADAARLDTMDDLRPDDDGNFATSRSFISRFVGRLPATERGAMVDADGQLSSTGYARVRNAVLAKAYGESPVLAKMVESLQDDQRNVSRALLIAAPRVAQAREAIEAGRRHPADITPHLMAAVTELGRLREAGRSVDDALVQQGLMGEERTPESAQLMRFLAENARRPRRIADFLTAYHDGLDAAGDPGQSSLLDDGQAPTVADLIEAAKRQVEPPPAPTAAPAAANDSPGTPAWRDFPAESGTLGIPRAKMPQVKMKVRPQLYAFLEGRGISSRSETVAPDSLKPTQAEFSPTKVQGARELTGEAAGVLVSSDGYVLDGHHRWLAKAANGEPVDVRRFDAPIDQLLDAVREFSGTTVSNESDVLREARAAAVEQFYDAAADLGDILTKHHRAAMIPEDTPDLMPTLVRLFESAIKIVGTDLKRATAWVKDRLRTMPEAKGRWNRILPETYRKAALEAIERAGAGDLADGQTPEERAKAKAQSYNPGRDNFKPPATSTFMSAGTIKAANDYIARLSKEAPEPQLDPAVRAEAEAILKPMLEAAAAAKLDYDTKILDIVQRTGAIGQMLAPLKKIGRSAEKLAQEPRLPDGSMDGSQMKDLLRSTIVVASYADAQKVLDAIGEEFEFTRPPKNRTGQTVLRYKGRDLQPLPLAMTGGYTDVLVNVSMPGGVVAEIQINVPTMLAAKAEQGHSLYEVARAQPDGSPLYREVYAAMEAFYAEAFMASTHSGGGSDPKAMPSEGPPLMSGQGRNSKKSSENLNQPSPGSSTNQSPPNVGTNREPGGKEEGDFTGTSDTQSVPLLADTRRPVNTDRRDTKQPGLFDDDNRQGTGSGAADEGARSARRPDGAGPAPAVAAREGRGDRPGGNGRDGQPTQPGALGQPGTGGERGGDAVAGRGVDQDGGAPADGAADRRRRGSPVAADIRLKSGLNWRYTDENIVARGSWFKRAAANVEAVELLKTLQKEGRKATADEQAVLARFVGWGASDIAQNLFAADLDERARLRGQYDTAVAAFEKRGNRPMNLSFGRGFSYPDGWFEAVAVLEAKRPKGVDSWKWRQDLREITREQLDAAAPSKDAARWKDLRDRMRAVMTTEELAEARRTTQYGHYTAAPVVRGIWAAVQRLGFAGGHVLEPGAGTGLFPGLMPEGVAAASSYTGVEYDSITGGILAQLFPDENVIVDGYQNVTLPRGFYDLAVGNPPFADVSVLSDREYARHAFSLHDYFFAKTLDRVKPGGVLAFVTSNSTMDKKGDKARAYFAERADLVGAIRLPNTTHKANAGTEVVTDILFFRKKVDGETFEGGQPFQGLAEVQTPQGPTLVNEYFAANPQMVLGRHALTGSMYRSDSYTVEPTEGQDLGEAIMAAVQRLPEGVFRPGRGTAAEAAAVREVDFNPAVKKEGSYYLSDAGVVMQREEGVGKRVTAPEAKLQVLASYVPLRDALKQAQYDQLTDGDWQTSLAALQKAYSDFTAKHGPISQSVLKSVRVKVPVLDEDGDPTNEKVWDVQEVRVYPTLAMLRDDPDYTLAQALEMVDEETGVVTPSDFLSKRVLGKAEPARIDSPQDAMLVVLNEVGRVDMAAIAARSGLSEEDAAAALGTSVFLNPDGQAWETADEYLSGNVRQKLKLAEKAAQADRRFERNVQALKAAQPQPKTPNQINVTLGQNWVPPEFYEQFIRETAGVRAAVRYNEATREWSVELDDRPVATRGGKKLKSHQTDRAQVEWGTEDRHAGKLLEHALTGRPIIIKRREGTGKDAKEVLDKVAVEAANAKLTALRDEFTRWVWTDAERTDRLVSLYNDRFNTLQSRRFDGRHLTLPGSSKSFKVFDHVKRGAWRIVSSGNTYLAHAVGSGKTFQMVIAAMEMKRLGVKKKPMIVVPNHMLRQFSSEWQQLYPMARLAVADEEAFHLDNRRRWMARVALSDLDGVIITQSAFAKLDIDPAHKAKIIGEQLDYLRATLEEASQEDDGDRKSPRTKQIENRIEKLEERLKKANSDANKDGNVLFDQLGVDMLFVDEAHAYRKLDFGTARQVKGLSPDGSARAMDLYTKVRWLDERYPGRSLVMASGTPVVNTLAELYSLQRFMNPQGLADAGLEAFDDWAAQHGRESTALERNAGGEYAPVTRMAKFVNVSTLSAAFRRFADVVTADELARLLGDRRPKVKGGQRSVIVTPKTQGYVRAQRRLAERFKISKEWKPTKDQPNNPDPVIAIIGDGRLAAIDERFVNPAAPNDPDSKLNVMIDAVIRAYRESAENVYTDKAGKPEPQKGSTMMVFSDLGFGDAVARNRGFSARAWMEKRLRDAGVPKEHVAFIQDYPNSQDKLKLFKDVNAGRVRILAGSSTSMGTGVNAQQRLLHLFHLDAPWFPADLEQREGRIVRQGNKNKEVNIHAFATKGSYDEQMWATLARKQKFIDQVMAGDETLDEVEDLDGVSQMEIAAGLVADDPRVLQLAGIKTEVARLERLYQAHENTRQRYRDQFRSAEATAAANRALLPKAEKDAAKAQDLRGDAFKATVGSSGFVDRTKWGEAILQAARTRAQRVAGSEVIGSISGFDVRFVSTRSDSAYTWQVVLSASSPAVLADLDTSNPMAVSMGAQRAVSDVARGPALLREAISQAEMTMDAVRPKLDAPFQFLEMLANLRRQAADLEVEISTTQAGEPIDSLWGPMRDQAQDPDTPDVVFSRGGVGGIALDDLRAVATRVQRAMPGLPPVTVLQSPVQAPAALRDFIERRGATSDAEGALFEGRIFLFASGIRDAARAEHVLAEHEAAHAGLRGLLGTRLKQQMQAVYNLNPRIRRQAEDLRKLDTRMSLAEAVEEVLVDMPTASLVKLQGWRGLMEAIAVGLRKMGLERMADAIAQWVRGTLTNVQRADLMVADLVRAARAHVRRRRATGAGGPMAAGAAMSRAWHGSPYRGIEKFSTDKIGTGEGAQAYGWGLYFAGRKEIAEHYRKTLTSNPDLPAAENTRKALRDALEAVDFLGFDSWQEAARAIRAEGFDNYDATPAEQARITKALRAFDDARKGQLYEVEIPEDSEMLLWDKPLSEQPPAVQRGIAKLFENGAVDDDSKKLIASQGMREAMKGKRLYEALTTSDNLDNDGTGRAASEALAAVGIKGIKYLDGTSRSAGEGTFNYVIFDGADVEVVARLSRASTAPATPVAETPASRAEALLAASASTPAPIDYLADQVTRVTGIKRLASMTYGLGGRLIERLTPEKVKAGIVSDYGVPEAVIDRRAVLQGSQREQMRQAGQILEKLATMTRAESRVAYEWMNMDGSDPQAYLSAMQGLPEESVLVLQQVQQMIDELSREAVRLGQLDEDTFKRHRFAYLRRSYFKHEAELTKSEAASRGRTISILGDQYKGRGMVAKAPMRQVQNVAPDWWQRKLKDGKADTALKGQKFRRLERRAPAGEGTMALQGVGQRQERQRLQEVHYWPADAALPARYADWNDAGTWEVRDTKGDDLVLWRDFTKDERERMGEIDEARFAIAKTLHRMIHDVEVGRYLDWLGTNYAKTNPDDLDGPLVEASEKYRHVFKPGEWVQVPSTKIQGTDVEKYGRLAGKYLPGPIWNDLRQITNGRPQILGEHYDRILQMWKISKTALSPGVHTNNIMSNMVMADWAGVSAGHIAKALRIILAAREDRAGILASVGNAGRHLGIPDAEAAREVMQRYELSGGSIGGWVTAELANDQMKPLLEALQAEVAGAAAASIGAEVGIYAALQHLLGRRFPQAWESLKASKPVRGIVREGETLIDLYQAEDDVFRLAAWLQQKEAGASDADAGKVARRAFLDYNVNAPWIAAARATAFPFIAFVYRAVPRLLDTMGNKPHKLLKLMALAGALNALGVALAGGGDDDERKLLPEEKAGRIWGIVPKLIRMPWNDDHGSPVYLDIRRWIPAGDIVDTGATNAAVPVIPAAIPGGPLALLIELISNKSQFTGKAITLETDTTGEKLGKVFDHVYKWAMPNILGLPGTYATEGVMGSIQGRTDAFGREMSTPMAVSSAFGVKLGSYPADVLRQQLAARTAIQQAELDTQIRALRRQRMRNGIDEEEFREKVEALQDKKRKLNREMADKLGAAAGSS